MALKDYTFRLLEDGDKPQVREWLAGDPDHQTGDPDFFTEKRPGVTHVVTSFEAQPVFYCTIENVARVHLQFNPQGSALANVKALMTGFKWLLASLKAHGYHEVIFNSRYEPLIRFCQKALGFFKSDQDYSARL